MLKWAHKTLRNSSVTVGGQTFSCDDSGILEPAPSEAVVLIFLRHPNFCQTLVEEPKRKPKSKKKSQLKTESPPPKAEEPMVEESPPKAEADA